MIPSKQQKFLPLLETSFDKERISTIVVGLPTTMRGTESDQTKKVIALTENLKKLFPAIEWKMWDERLNQ